MSSFPQFDLSSRVYLLKAWRRAMYVLLGTFLIGAGMFTGVATATGTNTLPAVILLLISLGGGIYSFAYGLRSRVVLSGSRITVRGALQEKTADRSEIEGMRTISTRSATYTQLCLAEGRGAIRVIRGFETDGDFDAWFRRIPDLDLRDRDAVLDQIAHDEALGATPSERLSTLRYATAWNVLLIVTAVMLALVLNLGDDSLQPSAALLLALLPVAVIVLVWRSPLLYAFLKQRKDPRTDLGFVLMVAGFGLLIRCRGIHLVDSEAALAAAAVIALVFVVTLFSFMSDGSTFWGRMIGLLLFAGLYGYGVVVLADTMPDHAQPVRYTTTVVGKHTSSGRSTSYILDLAPWGPVEEKNHISVSGSAYYRASIGDAICFNSRPGVFHIAWYTQIECNGAPSVNQ